MKKFVFGVIVGGIVFGSVGVLASALLANQIVYTPKDKSWNVKTVGEAIDDLKTSVKPTYTGSTDVTPSFSKQTLLTKDTILQKNITINAIPNTYKNLTTLTTITASDILKGKTAYDNEGNLITGTHIEQCEKGMLTCNSSSCLLFDYIPSMLVLKHNSTHRSVYSSDFGDYFYQFTTDSKVARYGNGSGPISYSNGKTYVSKSNGTVPYYACK